MKREYEYVVIQESTKEDFQERISRMLGDGFKCVGGVSFNTDEKIYQFYLQAMQRCLVKEDYPELD
jgi:hypothetical protein